MRVRSIMLRPFGRFDDASFDLAPGLNVIYGPNEAGKSTLHQALLTAVGGVKRGGGRRPEVEELRHRYRPWQAETWRVGAVVELADGSLVELTRNLDQSAGSRVTELGTGRDRSGEIIFEGAPDGWRWLGLDRTTYPATASVQQADVLRVGGSAGLLADQMQRAAAAGTDVTAARAIERIVEYQREHVGSVSRSSVKPLRRAIVAEEEAQARLEEARRAHDAYLRLAAEAKGYEESAEQRARERRCLEAARAAHHAQDERGELERVRELRARHPQPPPDLAADDHLAQSAAVALRTWRASREPAPLDGPTAAELRRRLDALPASPTGDTAPAPEVRRAADALAAATQSRQVHERRRPRPASPPPTTQPVERLQELARALETPARAGSERSWAARSAPILIAAALIAVLGFVALAATRDPLWLGAAVAVAVLAATYAWVHGHAPPPELALRRERAEAAAGEARALGLPGDPAALRALAHEVALSQQTATVARHWGDEHREHLEAEQAALRALQRVLAQRGAPDLASYERECAARREQAASAALRGPIEQQLAARRELEAQASRAASDRRAAMRSLRAVAVAITGSEAGPDTAPGEVEATVETWLGRREARLTAAHRRQAEWIELRSLLAAGSPAERERRTAEAEREAGELADGILGAELAQAIGRHDSPARLRALAEEEAEARTRADRAGGELDQHPARHLSVPEAQEALDQARAEVLRLKELGGALEQARHYLERAEDRVHRDLAPVLASTLRTWLPQVTGARYLDANVDPSTLSVTVCGADREWRNADHLSRGTQEQIYLLLRLALLEHLTRRGESGPVLCDEVTVHADGSRTEAVLTLLHRLSKSHQVLVFTQETAVRDWARRALTPDRDRLLELPAPAAA